MGTTSLWMTVPAGISGRPMPLTIERGSRQSHGWVFQVIAGNCSVMPIQSSIDVMAGAMNNLAFAVTCVAIGP